MTRIKANSTALLLAILVPAAFSAEKKTPAAPQAKTAPAEKSAPSLTALQLELKAAVEKFVAEVAEENDGLYPLNDTMRDDAWNVSLKSFDWAATRDIGPEEKLVRAAMTGQGKTFLVDFTAAKDGKSWEILDEIIFRWTASIASPITGRTNGFRSAPPNRMTKHRSKRKIPRRSSKRPARPLRGGPASSGRARDYAATAFFSMDSTEGK